MNARSLKSGRYCIVALASLLMLQHWGGVVRSLLSYSGLSRSILNSGSVKNKKSQGICDILNNLYTLPVNCCTGVNFTNYSLSSISPWITLQATVVKTNSSQSITEAEFTAERTKQLLILNRKMTSNILKNFAAATVAVALLSFVIASTTVGIAVVFHLTTGHSHQTGVRLLHR